MIAKTDVSVNFFPVSMVPWESFTAFNLNLPKGSTYLLPIFTAGKYFLEGSSYKPSCYASTPRCLWQLPYMPIY